MLADFIKLLWYLISFKTSGKRIMKVGIRDSKNISVQFKFFICFFFIYFYIYPLDFNERIGRAVQKTTVKQLSRPASGDARYCCLVEIFIYFCFFGFYWRFEGNLELLAKITKLEEIPSKVYFPGTQQNNTSRF